MATSKPLTFVRKLRGGFKPPWLDCTKWDTVVISSLATENEYVKRPLAQPLDNLARAAACAAVLQSTEAPRSRDVAPLRIGKIATDSVSTFQQLLHTAAAGHYALEATAPANTSQEKMRAAGSAWRHLHAAGRWGHQREYCPPQLKDDFRKTLQLVVLLLTADALHGRNSVRLIKVLQAIVVLAPDNSELQRWAMNEAKTAIAVHWAVSHTNPNVANSAVDVMLAYVACSALGDCKNEIVSKFLLMAGTVGGMGGLHDARLKLHKLGGAQGLLEPPQNIVDDALPSALLNQGNTSLHDCALTQCVVHDNGAQPIHPLLPGVVLSATRLPKPVLVDTVEATSKEPSACPPAPKKGWWPSSSSLSLNNVLSFPTRTTTRSAAKTAEECLDSDFM